MQCSGCGTVLQEGQFTCPNCGRMVWSRGSKAAAKPTSSKASVLGDSSARLEELELSDPALEAGGATAFTPDVQHVREMLADDPSLLEKGLTLMGDAGSSGGIDHPTDVGSIDILARDSGGGLVVVMVTKGDSGSDIVAEVLQRIGWVRKHVAKKREGVRGVVLMQNAPENLSYAAAAVSDTVSFRTYRIKLSFDEVEI
jgi:RecB family endonuclease NucS